jgi:hypothetical protein
MDYSRRMMATTSSIKTSELANPIDSQTVAACEISPPPDAVALQFSGTVLMAIGKNFVAGKF